jgi:Lactate racemase N-terminal domain
MKYPKMIRIKQSFNTRPIKDIPAEVRNEFAGLQPQKMIARGDTVAITAGSRGIANLAVILGEIVQELKKIGAKPFIVPAMGSHGGATAEGQKKILEHYGITKKAMGVPVKSSMSVVQVGETSDGIPVYLDRNASKADHIVVVNRVKLHTDFKGKFESGLMKMMVIGLGKQKGADHYHNVIVRKGHYPVLLAVAREIMRRCPVAFGVALVENQRDETQIIRAIPAAEIEATEYELLKKAKRLFPRIPVDPIDLLIVDQMGKSISGTGMDQNVIGRSVIPYHRPWIKTDIMRIFVRDLTADSEGNATAIGNADFTTKRLVKKINHQATYMNAITSSCPEAVRIPPYYNSDREAIETALKTIGPVESHNARIVHILDTLRLEEMYVSESMLADVEKRKNLSVIGSPGPLKFDAKGNLISTF